MKATTITISIWAKLKDSDNLISRNFLITRNLRATSNRTIMLAQSDHNLESSIHDSLDQFLVEEVEAKETNAAIAEICITATLKEVENDTKS
jgi:hypothetical protein